MSGRVEWARLFAEADREYLERRIRDESLGDHGIDDIKD